MNTEGKEFQRGGEQDLTLGAIRVDSVTRRGLIQLHFAVFLLGWPGLFAKWLPMSPGMITCGRTFFAALALGTLLALSRRGFSVASRKDFFLLTLAGAILALHWTAFFHSVQVSTVAVAVLVCASAPIFTAVLEPYFFREQHALRDFGAAVAAFIGTGILISDVTHDDGGGIVLGVAWGFVAAISFSFIVMLNRRHVRRYSSILVTFYQNAVAALLLSFFYAGSLLEASPREFALLAILGIVFTAGAFSTFTRAMRSVSARVANVTISLSAVYGITLAALFLNELPSLRVLLGGALIFASSVYVTRKKNLG